MFYGKRQMFAPDFIAWLEGFRFPAYHLERRGDQYELTFEGPWIETTMWEMPGARRADGAAQPRRDQGHGQVRAAGALRARHDAGVGEDRPAEEAAGPQHRRFRHAPAARLPVAGLVRAGDDRRPGPVLPRHLQLPDRHAARGGGHRHQCARAADGLLRARRQRPRAGGGALQGAGRLAGGLRRQPARHAARHLRLAAAFWIGRRTG